MSRFSRIRRTQTATVFLLLLPVVLGQDYDCRFTIGATKYDFTQLHSEHKLSRTIDSPPTQVIQELRFDLCEPLGRLEGVPDSDQVRCTCWPTHDNR